jgi:OOP family OmpA-OmpF porin
VPSASPPGQSRVEGRAQNRRTLFVNAALRGRPIGGMPVDGGGRVGGDPCAK